MRGASQIGSPSNCDSWILRRTMIAVAVGAITALLVLPSAAQWHGPPTSTTVGGHSLTPSPSVLSVAGPHLAPPLPSVTSIPNYGYTNFGYARYGRYGNGYGRRRGYGYGSAGYSYSIPYYIPMDGYGYDYVGGPGPELYSGPPITVSDAILHIVVEQPPVRYRSGEPDSVEPPPSLQPMPQELSAAHEARPNEPIVLVFRDGHKQEAANYAIMGQTVYVFDKHTQKIALADLDVPATVKANEDRGLDFKIPPQKPAQKKADIELKVPAEPDTTSPAKIASITP